MGNMKKSKKIMKFVPLSNRDLRGFLDKGERLNQCQLKEFNHLYKELCESATDDEIRDCEENYGDIYPPFVCEILEQVTT